MTKNARRAVGIPILMAKKPIFRVGGPIMVTKIPIFAVGERFWWSRFQFPTSGTDFDGQEANFLRREPISMVKKLISRVGERSNTVRFRFTASDNDLAPLDSAIPYRHSVQASLATCRRRAPILIMVRHFHFQAVYLLLLITSSMILWKRGIGHRTFLKKNCIESK